MEEKNIMKIEKSYITSEDSLCIYGIAILMMVWHHFFGFPERFHGNLQYFGGNFEYTIELYLGYFGRLCIAMYAFISGYGMTAKSEEKNLKLLDNIKQAINQIINFLIRYWLVFIIFIPIGLKMGILKFKLGEFIGNLIGKSCSYNAEWWYVSYYIKMLVTYPIIKTILNKLKQKRMKNLVLLLMVLILIIINCLTSGRYTYYLCFWFGMIIYTEEIYSKVKERMPGKFKTIITSFIGIIFCIVFRMISKINMDEVLVVIYIFCVLQLLKEIKVNHVIRKLLQFLGSYSMYIWLIHTFFLYYYFQNQLLKIRFSILIYVITICICTIIGYMINKIYGKLKKHVIKL